MKRIEEQFIETVPVERQAFFWVSLYYYLAKAAFLLPQGEAVIREATRNYGRERAGRRRNIVLQKGLPLDLVSLFTNGDLNGDTRFKADAKRSSLTPELRKHFVTRCPDAEMWQELGDDETHIGQTYCEEVHHTLYGCYDSAVQVNLCETITHGNPICRFYIYLRKANQKVKPNITYEPQVWEDTGADGIRCNFTMFALFYYHLAKNISEKLGMDILKKGLCDFARQRGRRLRELDRRAGRKTGVHSLINEGDLFLDSRFVIRQKAIPLGVELEIDRCVFAEVQLCHDASALGALYCSLLYKELVKAYDPQISIEVVGSLCEGKKQCIIRFTEKDRNE